MKKDKCTDCLQILSKNKFYKRKDTGRIIQPCKCCKSLRSKANKVAYVPAKKKDEIIGKKKGKTIIGIKQGRNILVDNPKKSFVFA